MSSKKVFTHIVCFCLLLFTSNSFGNSIHPTDLKRNIERSGDPILKSVLACPTDTPVITLVKTCTCYNFTVSVSGGVAPYSYKWTGPTAIKNAGIGTCVSAGNYAVTITDATGCILTARKVVPVFTALSATPTTINTICGRATGAITLNTVGGDAPYKYVWSGPSGFVATSANINGLSAGVYNVVVTDNSGCTTTASATVGTNQNNFDIASSVRAARDTNICIGSALNLLKPGFDSVNVTYTWTASPSATLVGNNPRVAPTVSTKYFLTATGTCVGTVMDSVIVKVFTPTKLVGANDTTVCRDTKVRLGFNIIDPTVRYSWNPTIGIDSVNNPNATLTAQPSLNNIVPIQYVLTAVNAGGCISNYTVKIVGVDLRMKITPADSVRLCRNDTITLAATTSPIANQAVKWSSNKDYNLADSVNSIRVNPSRVTKYYATISLAGCTRNDSVTVYVDSLPFNRMIIPQDTNICMNAIAVLRSPTFESVLFPKIKFLWYGGKGFLTPDSLYDMVIQGDTTRTYSRVATNGVCKLIDTVRVIVTPLPIVTLTPAQTTFCPGQEAPVLLSAIIKPNNLTDIKWKDPQGMDIPSAKGNTSYTVPAGGSGTYTITVKNGNCPASASATINAGMAPAFGPPKAVICAGTSISLNTLPTSSYTYVWSGPNGFTSTDPAPTVTPTAVSTYSVTITNPGGCGATKSVTVTPATATLAKIPDAAACVGSAATITAVPTSNVSNLTYLWSNGATTPSITVSPKASITYTVTLTYGDNCTTTATANVNVLPNITVNIVPDTFAKFVDVGTVLKLDAIITGSSTAPTYSWTSNGQAVSSTSNLTFGLTDDTKVTVTATTANGCNASYSVNIQARFPNFQIPNAFTPNGDTINNTFTILFNDGKNFAPPQVRAPTFWKGAYNVVSFQVFSRYGKALYEETNAATLNTNTYKGWDGTTGGNDVAPDVYVYLIKLILPDGTAKSVSGEVNLIR